MSWFSKIKFGDGLSVTDEGDGVILVSGGGGGGGGGGIQFDTSPQAGNWLYVEADDPAGAGGSPNGYGIELHGYSSDITLAGDYASQLHLNFGLGLDAVMGDAAVWFLNGDYTINFDNATRDFTITDNYTTERFRVHSDGKIFMPSLPTTDPGVSGALWSSSGDVVLSGYTGGGGGGGGGGEVGYDQITSPVAVSSGTEASGTTIITASAHTFDGNPVYAEFYSPLVQFPTTAGAGLGLFINLFEGSTEISRLGYMQSPSADAQGFWPCFCRYRFTPSAGSHTYKVTGNQSGGVSPTVHAGVGSGATYPPAFLRFVKA